MTNPPEKPLNLPWTEERIAALRLTTAWEIGARTLQKIRTRYRDVSSFISHPDTWDSFQLTPIQRNALQKASQKNTDELIALLNAQRIRFLLPEDPGFPSALRKTEDPPFAIFSRGLPIVDGMHVAVVGTRRLTNYGRQATQLIASELTRYGATIVSGFALGADISAHTACVEAGGHTIGVLPGGVDNASIVPRSHTQFAKRILDQGVGALLSEYPPGTPILPFHFLIRNRLIAALADAVVVTEGNHDSGALVTARLAIESGREVLAIPGSIFLPTSRGTNMLIADGARPCRSAEDVLAALGLKNAAHAKQIAESRQTIPTSPEEERILTELKTPHSIDDLARRLKEPVANMSAIISILELKGRLHSVGPRIYVAAR